MLFYNKATPLKELFTMFGITNSKWRSKWPPLKEIIYLFCKWYQNSHLWFLWTCIFTLNLWIGLLVIIILIAKNNASMIFEMETIQDFKILQFNDILLLTNIWYFLNKSNTFYASMHVHLQYIYTMYVTFIVD